MKFCFNYDGVKSQENQFRCEEGYISKNFANANLKLEFLEQKFL